MNRKNVIAAVWLIGLGLLFMVDYIWPGILILIGITMIVNATMREEPTVMPPTDTLRQAQGTATSPMVEPVDAPLAEPAEAPLATPYEPPSAEPVATLRQAQGTASTSSGQASSATAASNEPLPAVLASAAERLYLASLLPENCPACNAPLRTNAEKLAWHADNSVSCMFCGYRMTVKTE